MEPTQQTSKQFFRTINTLFFALFAGQLIFAGIVIFLQSGVDLSFRFPGSEDMLTIVGIVIAIIELFVSRLMYRIQINKIKKDSVLSYKLAIYQTAVIIKLALIEGASLFLIVSFLLTANPIALIFLAIMFIQFYLFKPSREEAIRDLQLDYNETAQVNNPDAIIGEIKNL
ncbi:hypothetical protein ACE1ET_04350 [Saccharicrinis sp. FJH62]|uniref:hypothetical protein n=1 Tax=Saccharicrinis sp. FJH62 TaxID=3344657 RepID=UPI0035D4DB3D